MEKAGVPTITIATDAFISLARSTQVSQGMTDMCFVVVPHPVGGLPLDQLHAKVDAAYQDLLDAAVKWRPTDSDVKIELKPYPAPRFDFTGTFYDVNEMFKTRNWSLSLPVMPPTEEAVAAMLKGTKRDPAEVIWVVPPRQGMLTVELIAALGVMAGAKPEHMPLLIAAAEAFSQPEANWRGTTTTTASTYPMMLISGPIIDELGLISGTGVSGPQNPATNALGYFINLVGDIVGGSIAPLDMSTHGSAADFVAPVFVENPDNPWGQSFAEERGFKATDNVLTAYAAYPVNNGIDHNSVAGADLLNTFAAGIAGSSTGITGCFTTYTDDYNESDIGKSRGVNQVMLMIAPEHADTIARDFSKAEAREYLVKNTLLPFKGYARSLCVPPESFGPVTPETWVPRFANGNGLFFVVTGGAGKHSQLWTTFPSRTKPVSVLIGD